MNRSVRGSIMLFTTAFIWGSAFVAQKAGMDYIGPFTYNGLRSLLGALVLVPVVLLVNALQKKKGAAELSSDETGTDRQITLKQQRKTLLAGGLACGVALFIGSSLQQIGLVYSSAGKAGFITALYIVLVPILGLFIGRKVRRILWLSVALATAGLYLLCIKENFTIGKGDILIIICAFAFAVHILIIDHFSPKVDGIKMSCLQFLFAGLFSIPFMLIFETINWSDILAGWFPILYTAVMSCGIAYTLQIIGQKDVEPAVASLILSLESVFAVITGIIVLHEQISTRELIGCIIMFAAIILAQLPAKKEKPAEAAGLAAQKADELL
jgi:drug/metabolite transporter (DMT)-like permease